MQQNQAPLISEAYCGTDSCAYHAVDTLPCRDFETRTEHARGASIAHHYLSRARRMGYAPIVHLGTDNARGMTEDASC
jgi:hypothetical protein